MQVGRAIGALVAQGALELKPMAEHILKAESEEDPERGQDEDAGMPTHALFAVLKDSTPGISLYGWPQWAASAEPPLNGLACSATVELMLTFS